MQLHKTQLEQFVHSLPDPVDSDEVMYRLYLMQILEAGERDICQGKTVSHQDVCARLAARCTN
jgi:hypothetical protein